jgi:hypothetical protein
VLLVFHTRTFALPVPFRSHSSTYIYSKERTIRTGQLEQYSYCRTGQPEPNSFRLICVFRLISPSTFPTLPLLPISLVLTRALCLSHLCLWSSISLLYCPLHSVSFTVSVPLCLFPCFCPPPPLPLSLSFYVSLMSLSLCLFPTVSPSMCLPSVSASLILSIRFCTILLYVQCGDEIDICRL